MAQISTPLVSPKAYRHFSAITLVVTCAVAFFGTTQPDRPFEQTVAPRPPEPEAGSGATPAYGEARLVVHGNGVGSFGVEAGPGSSPIAGGRGSRGFINSANLPPANSENAAFTPAFLDSLSEEELDALLQGLRSGGIESDEEIMRATAVMEAASRRRSGHRVTQG